ncbi:MULTISPECIES: PDR/VanB family oxidoreductase [Burkholderiales]|uniref:PDR/VanB family oxidoreductase n=1 Tax=Piscinibacter gummiphilus TaxID=946333 RepID=A0ABZ0CXJ9_9BURK|nr:MULTISPECIES: PDR/VanB family oxidoreductase [Burkholderiales]MBP6895741.1 oxidoreductase [Pseudacidovorax sp.]WOB09677.1 PDR/VanB family oxidoreductase [Piscinibacter gummiphilus]
MSGERLFDVRVVALREEAPGVVSCELQSTSGELPSCPPGAHVDVHLPNGLVRQYSVASATADSYQVAVKRKPASRGGSAFMTDSLRIGSLLRIGAPRDNFPLVAANGRTVLIAGGIGITALLPMARLLAARGLDWTLHYAVRAPEDAAFKRALQDLGDRIRLHASSTAGCRLSIEDIVMQQPAGTHFYCCGPASMLDAFLAATTSLPPEQVHFERFGAEPTAGGQEFVVRLARSGQVLPVAADQTIVDALLAAGVDAPYSCQQGICGSCEVKVLQGSPDHRDDVLTEAEKASNKTMMICCSRACSPELVLDL